MGKSLTIRRMSYLVNKMPEKELETLNRRINYNKVLNFIKTFERVSKYDLKNILQRYFKNSAVRQVLTDGDQKTAKNARFRVQNKNKPSCLQGSCL